MNSIGTLLFSTWSDGLPLTGWLDIESLMSVYATWGAAAVLVGALMHAPARWPDVLAALASAALAAVVATAITAWLQTGRPPEAGWIARLALQSADSELPSAETAAMSAFAGFLLLSRRLRIWGMLAGALTASIGWARCFVGDDSAAELLSGLTVGLLLTCCCIAAFSYGALRLRAWRAAHAG